MVRERNFGPGHREHGAGNDCDIVTADESSEDDRTICRATLREITDKYYDETDTSPVYIVRLRTIDV